MNPNLLELRRRLDELDRDAEAFAVEAARDLRRARIAFVVAGLAGLIAGFALWAWGTP